MMDQNTFKKFLNKIKNTKSYSNMNKISSTCSKSSGGCGRSCICDEDSDCTECTCEKPKAKKPNSETIRDDGCFCRNPKCNTFMPMAEPDDVGDGKALCYKCKHPW